MPLRDPISVHYDGFVHTLLARAIRAGQSHKSVQVWIASPRAEFAHLDPGGRTVHERAFVRSVYHIVFKDPINHGHAPDWSVKLNWGHDGELRASSGNRWARPVKVRIWPRSEARVRGPRWTDDPNLQSKLADDGRRVIPHTL